MSGELYVHLIHQCVSVMTVASLSAFLPVLAFGISYLPMFVIEVSYLPVLVSGVINSHSQIGQSQKWPADGRGDAYPAPRPSDHGVFANRVLQWHVLYCGTSRVCRNHAPSSCYRCSPCQCDLNCTRYGDCCPDLVLEGAIDDFYNPFTGNDRNVLSCQSAVASWNAARNSSDQDKLSRLKKRQANPIAETTEGLEQGDPRYFMVSSCPHSFTGDAQECEKSGQGPVTGFLPDSTPQVFKNKFCARCHQVLELVLWDLHVSCPSRHSLPLLSRPGLVLQSAMSQCSVSYRPPAGTEVRRCYTVPDMVSRCNVTGQWAQRDSFLERACHSYSTPKRVAGALYKNVYCYMCNAGHQPETQVTLTSCQHRPAGPRPALEVTLPYLDLDKPDVEIDYFGDTPYKRCGDGKRLYDSIQDSCREVTCSHGRQLVGGTCRPLFRSVRGLGYELYFGLHPQEPIDVSNNRGILHRLPSEMEVYLGQNLLQDKLHLEDFAMSFNTTDQFGRCGQWSSNLGVYARLVSKELTDQKTLENDLLQVGTSKFQLAIDKWNDTFQAFSSESVWHVLQPTVREAPQTLSACVIIVANIAQRRDSDGTIKVGTSTADPTSSRDLPTYIRVSSLLTCPQVRLNPGEFFRNGLDGPIKLAWGDVLPSDRYIVDLEGNVRICLADFRRKLDQTAARRSATEETMAIVLLSVSVLCLLVSFVVFLTFSVLRSLLGVNNMVLVVCLCLAQLSMLIGYLDDDTSKLCSLTGVAAHYFSLCSFCALTVCSYHVYSVFATMHLSRDAARDRKVVILYCCFIFIVPMVLVATLVAIFVSVHSRHWGYGPGSLCLLSSSLALWLTVFLPAAALLVCAVLLYCLTCNTLQHNTDVETSHADERHVNFYFRLSLLITLTWIIGVVGLVTSLAPLMMTFIVLQCLSGVYVFVSLVLTPRVARLLSGSCCQSKHPPRGRTSLHMKMASSNDCPVSPPCIMGTGYRKRDPSLILRSQKPPNPVERYIRRGEFDDTAA